MSGFDDVNRYSGSIRPGQVIALHDSDGIWMYGSIPPISGRRPSELNEATVLRGSSVPSSASIARSRSTGMRRTLTGTRLVAGSRFVASISARR